MKFTDKPCYYKFCIIVRNKDGKSPLINSSSNSGETMIKSWFVDSMEYYNKVKPEMIALAEHTRGRLYMALDRKDTHKTILQLFTEISEIMKRIIFGDTTVPKRLNKIVNSVSSNVLCSEKTGKTLMYDIDCKDMSVLNGVIAYVLDYVQTVTTLETKNGYHVVVRKCFPITNNWQEEVSDFAISYAKLENPKLTVEESLDIINKVKDIRVQQNQLGLVYFNFSFQ